MTRLDCVKLVFAIIHQAMVEAYAGSSEAMRWLEEESPYYFQNMNLDAYKILSWCEDPKEPPTRKAFAAIARGLQ